MRQITCKYEKIYETWVGHKMLSQYSLLILRDLITYSKICVWFPTLCYKQSKYGRNLKANHQLYLQVFIAQIIYQNQIDNQKRVYEAEVQNRSAEVFPRLLIAAPGLL
ncbi:Hypothetical_protein [Hexamita inflata]|uniref:Hypothetical_protein n=1 Tax=Hexamita inflata TaxID=28002 RepID=A0AA86P2E3_9EUKA|nr:Hypothetical protein HINF_LOCUS18006 [Hexamita inflata]